MASPEYLICLNCESPTYDFEWKDDEIVEALCETCGNDEADQFLSEDDFEALIGG